MSNQFQNRNMPKPNALGEWKLRLSADPVNGGQKRPSMSLSVSKNNPRLTVRTNVEGDKDYGKIVAAMDTPTFYSLMRELAKLATESGKTKRAVENHNYIFPGGKRSEKPVLVSTTMVGREEDGRIYIAVIANDRPKIKFYFSSPYFHHLIKEDGSKFSPAEDSASYCLSTIESWKALIPFVLYHEYVEPDFNKRGGGGNNNGGGGNNWGGNSGGGNYGGNNSGGASAGGDDMDFPF